LTLPGDSAAAETFAYLTLPATALKRYRVSFAVDITANDTR
jgi:hypothetical protein